MFHATYLEAGLLVATAVAAVPIGHRLRVKRVRIAEPEPIPSHPLLRHPQPPSSPPKPAPPKKEEPSPKKEEPLPKKEEPPKFEGPVSPPPESPGVENRSMRLAGMDFPEFKFTHSGFTPGHIWFEIELTSSVSLNTGPRSLTFALPPTGAPWLLMNSELPFFVYFVSPGNTLQDAGLNQHSGGTYLGISGGPPVYFTGSGVYWDNPNFWDPPQPDYPYAQNPAYLTIGLYLQMSWNIPQGLRILIGTISGR